MTPNVIGLVADEAEQKLKSAGFDVQRITYVSRRGVPDADSTRVIRQRALGNNSIKLTVSHFKTRMETR